MRIELIAVFAFLLPASAAAIDPRNARFNGYSALELSQGQIVNTGCSVTWTDPEGSGVYCFSSEQARDDFARDPQAHLAKAEQFYAQARARSSLQRPPAPEEADDAPQNWREYRLDEERDIKSLDLQPGAAQDEIEGWTDRIR